MLELKFDKETMFEWQKASQDSLETPHFEKLLAFIDLRAQASETCVFEPRKPFIKKYPSRSIASHSRLMSLNTLPIAHSAKWKDIHCIVALASSYCHMIRC